MGGSGQDICLPASASRGCRGDTGAGLVDADGSWLGTNSGLCADSERSSDDVCGRLSIAADMLLLATTWRHADICDGLAVRTGANAIDEK